MVENIARCNEICYNKFILSTQVSQDKLRDSPSSIKKHRAILMDVYFRRAHWFMLLFHAPSARMHAKELWRKPAWRRTEAGDVLVFSAVAAMGAQCIKHDPTSHAYQVLREQGIEPVTFSQDAVAEISRHLLDIVTDCSLASVQLCLLLARFHSYAGNPGMGWACVPLVPRFVGVLLILTMDTPFSHW